MIFEAAGSVIKAFIVVLVALIPNAFKPLISDVIVGLGQFTELMGNVTYFLPMGTIILCTSIYIFYYASEFFISLVNWIIRKIPTIE